MKSKKTKNIGVNGVVRRIDTLGRIVIPCEYRKVLGIESGDTVEMILEKGGMVIKPFKEETVKPLSRYTKEELLNELERRSIENCG